MDRFLATNSAHITSARARNESLDSSGFCVQWKSARSTASNRFSSATLPHCPPKYETNFSIALGSLRINSSLCNCNFWKALPVQLRINLVANSPSFCWGQAPTRSSTFCVQISKESFDGSNVGTKDQRWLLIAVSLATELDVVPPDSVPIVTFPKVSGGYQSSPLIAPLPIWLAESFQSSHNTSSKMSSRGSSTFSPSTRSIESGFNHRQQKGDHTQKAKLPELNCQAKAKPTNDPPQALLSQTPSNEGCDTWGLCPSLPATLVEITIYI